MKMNKQRPARTEETPSSPIHPLIADRDTTHRAQPALRIFFSSGRKVFDTCVSPRLATLPANARRRRRRQGQDNGRGEESLPMPGTCTPLSTLFSIFLVVSIPCNIPTTIPILHTTLYLPTYIRTTGRKINPPSFLNRTMLRIIPWRRPSPDQNHHSFPMESR
jgi:hypothetical protein